MVDKRISDLEVTTDLQDTTLFHVRKTETNEDFKITKANLVKQIGNSVVSGFNATSPSANRILLTPSNSGSLDQYYNGMTIKFISPINSTDLVKIKIGSLGYIDFKTTFTNPITNVVENGVLKTGKFYEAIYSNNSFIQTNIDRQYTNEYLSIGEIIFDNATQEYFTLYTLTSATSYYKTQYYEGMSIVFTSGIIANSVENMSNGKIYIDIDGLGVKLLSDPDGDGVPFSLQPNETILGIYDGEKFVKNIFSMQEPELPVPVDPNNPPPGYDITVYVGPNEPEVSNRLLQTAYDRIVKDYGSGGGGRKVTIKFRDNYTGEGLLVKNISPITNSYITLEGNPNVTMLPSNTTYSGRKAVIYIYNQGNPSYANFTIIGTWKVNFPTRNSEISQDYSFLYNDVASNINKINIKNATFININQGNQNYVCFIFEGYLGNYFLEIENSEFIDFGEVFYTTDNGVYKGGVGFNCNAKNITITNTITVTRSFSYLIDIVGKFNFINLVLNLSKPSNYTNIIRNLNRNIYGYYTNELDLSDSQIIITEVMGGVIIFSNSKLTINNCTIKYENNVSNIKGSIEATYIAYGSTKTSMPHRIIGNNYLNKNSATIPDILVNSITLYLKSGTLGSTQTINGGSIVNV
jgi:hypothetical protein